MPPTRRALEADATVVLGGDGTILGALREFGGRMARPSSPSTSVRSGSSRPWITAQLDAGIERLVSGDFEVIEMPALSVDVGGTKQIGVNDISFHRRVGRAGRGAGLLDHG